MVLQQKIKIYSCKVQVCEVNLLFMRTHTKRSSLNTLILATKQCGLSLKLVLSPILYFPKIGHFKHLCVVTLVELLVDLVACWCVVIYFYTHTQLGQII